MATYISDTEQAAHLERMEELSALWTFCLFIFANDANAARNWLLTPLNVKWVTSPMYLLNNPGGVAHVRELLDKIPREKRNYHQ